MKRTLISLLLCACGNAVNPASSATEPTRPPVKNYGGDPLTSTCQRPLLGSTATEAFLLRADGTRVSLARGGDQAWVGTPVARGGFIAVTTTALRDNKYVSRLDLFDADGALLSSGEGGGEAVLSELGFAASWAGDGDLLVVRADGTSSIVTGMMPGGEFGPRGLLPVWKSSGTERVLAIYDVGSGAVQELSIPLSGWSAPIWSSDTLVYIGELDGKTLLVRQLGAQSLTTPIAASNNFGSLAVEQIAGNTVVLVTGSWVQVRSRLDLDTGVLTPLDAEPPAGFVFAGRHSASLADDGSLVAAFQTDGASGLYRSLDGKSWSPMGGSVAGATSLVYAGRNGSWLVSAYGTLGAAGTLGLVPAMGLSQTLPVSATGAVGAEAISSDGRCAAVWSGDGSHFTLTTADLLLGTQRAVLETDARPAGAGWR